MNRLFTLAAATLLMAGTAVAQETSPTPGQPGPSASPGTPTSSDRDPNNPAASRDAGPQRPMGTTGSGAPAASGSQNNMTGPATKAPEKEPQRNDPTPDRQKNVQ